MRDNLEIEFWPGFKGKKFAVVKNFPGLDAEMSVEELRKMAESLERSAEELERLNGLKQNHQ